MAFIITWAACSAQRVSVGFYNVENLYDTIPSLFYDDSDYTPQGRFKWGGERYERKLSNLARVIDEMALDVVALAEVESEEALRDLVMRLKTEYSYIHRHTDDSRGMDVALLYKGDMFFPERVRQVNIASTRQLLHVRGELLGCPVDFAVVHMPSNLNSQSYRVRAFKALHAFSDSMARNNGDNRLIIMGDMNAVPAGKVITRNFPLSEHNKGAAFYFNPLYYQAKQGMGSYAYRGRRFMYDNIFLSDKYLSAGGMKYVSAGVFVRGYMLSEGGVLGRGVPLRTFSGAAYPGGYSDHLPVFCILELINME